MAGKVSYLLDKKLIQLEGLVGGKKIIQNIKAENNLCEVLKEFGVDIYLSSKVLKNATIRRCNNSTNTK